VQIFLPSAGVAIFVSMKNEAIKTLILTKLDKLNKQWTDIVNNEERTTPMDYMRVAEVQGGINVLMELISQIDFKASE
jgi:hypothetical protein